MNVDLVWRRGARLALVQARVRHRGFRDNDLADDGAVGRAASEGRQGGLARNVL